jgi:hypothetical protein
MSKHRALVIATFILSAACGSSSGLPAGTDAGGGTGGEGGAAGTGGAGATGGSAGATGGSAGATGGSAGAGSGGTSGTGGAADAAVDGPGAGACPAQMPAASATCSRVGLVCEYGSDPRRECRSYATCMASGAILVWQLQTMTCQPLPPATCPATRASADGQPCTPKGAYCSYDMGLTCQCTDCLGGPVAMCTGAPVWRCEAPNMTPGCPMAQPALGSPCASEGKLCTYHCGKAGGSQCTKGVWVGTQGGPCPISTRTAKQDIRYLTAADRERVARQIEAIRLATYRYKDPVLGREEHLGFIIEDNPGLYAVDRRQSMVDLYGYTSMLLAATQTQAVEIEQLKAEVARLSAIVSARPRARGASGPPRR